MTDSTQRSSTSRWPAILFAATLVVFVVALCSPAFQSTSTHVIQGYDAFLMTIWHTFFPWTWIELFGSGDYLFISVPIWLTLMMGTFANLTLIVPIVASWFLRRRAVTVCYLAACGLLAGLLMPIVGVAGGWADGNLRDFYGGLYFGYWLWIAALALHALAWWSVVRNQRRMRVVLRHDAGSSTAIQPREQLAVDDSPRIPTTIESEAAKAAAAGDVRADSFAVVAAFAAGIR